jgi:hypothetical protein
MKDCGPRLKLSFIWHPTALSMFDVVAAYDMDIVRVIYMMCKDREDVLSLDGSVRAAIHSKMATLTMDPPFQRTIPTHREVQKFSTMLKRMIKYSQRGFSFRNSPVIHALSINTKK